MSIYVKFSEVTLSSITPQKIESVIPKMILSSWSLPECHIELLQTHFVPKLPTGMEVEECIGAIWRVKATSENVQLKFNCTLESNLLASPEFGEGLVAQSFENTSSQIYIGTEDEEYLIQRAGKYWLPDHFKNKIFAELIQCIPTGIQVTFPSLGTNEILQLHFIVAWTSVANKPISAWYAVDQSPEWILYQVGIK